MVNNTCKVSYGGYENGEQFRMQFTVRICPPFPIAHWPMTLRVCLYVTVGIKVPLDMLIETIYSTLTLLLFCHVLQDSALHYTL